ncbi:MAG: GatB/YqeY domain-containing protein [Bacteroidales bacterium]|nr:GatB/YqeY domain-containing protein [Bacteroidales bacterium]
MTLTEQIQEDMKSAMKEKNQAKLAAVRAIKSEILKEQTSGKSDGVTDADVLKIIQKMIKQRTDSVAIYQQQGRQDLVEEENAQMEFIKCYLPKQLSEAEVEAIINKIVAETGAASIKDMGKVMKAANAELAGKADGKMIADKVKAALNK